MALKYVGDSFLPGVPARDLTDDEEKEYGTAFKEREGATLESTGLYVREDKRSKPKEEDVTNG